MPHTETRDSGWRATVLVWVTFVYFLIFAQFAYLKRLAELGIAGTHLQAVLGTMALGGVLTSLLAPRKKHYPTPPSRIRMGLFVSGIAALLTLLHLGFATALAVSSLIGTGLGLLTVTVATHLRRWSGDRSPLLSVGVGTGCAYFVCNIPPFFTASPQVQATAAALLCLAGLFLPLSQVQMGIAEMPHPSLPAFSFRHALACFTALVWLDSAAFFIIQGTPALKAGTWGGTAHLWTNGCVHLAAALVGAWLLLRRGLPVVLSAAFVALGLACLLLLDPHRIVLASALYPIGVSLYSVALVAYPSLIAPAASVAERGRQAGMIYAIAGWIGSAMGIGMSQNLGHVPPAFVLGSGIVVLLPWASKMIRHRKREIAVTAVVLLVAFCIERAVHATRAAAPLTQIERGRQVYISEGCINCHSQYVRPNSPDALMWGPVESIGELRHERPPLIGNRRQGPDLAEVGGRRSPLWLKAHFYDPPEVSGASIMPPFGFLFDNRRGDDLVAYLQSLRSPDVASQLVQEDKWHLTASAIAGADVVMGKQLFQQRCATCHDTEGRTRQLWQASFKRLPPNVAIGPFQHLSASDSPAQRIDRLAHIVKFGIPTTDMPGHEYMPDREIASISLWLSRNIAQPIRNK
jgi:cytochrome c oxidase cbb3-type subunit 2